MGGKSQSEQDHEMGQADGSGKSGDGYSGYAAEDIDAYNAGYDNGRENPSPDNDD